MNSLLESRGEELICIKRGDAEKPGAPDECSYVCSVIFALYRSLLSATVVEETIAAPVASRREKAGL